MKTIDIFEVGLMNILSNVAPKKFGENYIWEIAMLSSFPFTNKLFIRFPRKFFANPISNRILYRK